MSLFQRPFSHPQPRYYAIEESTLAFLGRDASVSADIAALLDSHDPYCLALDASKTDSRITTEEFYTCIVRLSAHRDWLP